MYADRCHFFSMEELNDMLLLRMQNAHLSGGPHSTAHLDSIEDFTHYFHALILVLHVPHLQTEEPKVMATPQPDRAHPWERTWLP